MRPRGHFRMKFEELSGLAGGFWYYARTTMRGVRGYVYHMSKRLSDTERAKVEHYGNTRILRGSVKHAPELRFDVVFIGERCFTDGEKLQRELVFEN